MKKLRPNDNHYLAFPTIGKSSVGIQLSVSDVWECKEGIFTGIFLLKKEGITITMIERDLERYFEEIVE